MASTPKSNRWLRIEYLFYAALELQDGRAAFLDEACGGDDELRREVETLLHSSGQTIGFLQKPVLEAAKQIAAEETLSGKRIGAYQLLRVIGEGGMGKVYLAARADDLYQKQVAIKTVPVGLGQSQALLLRFGSERQILANLDHPNIARLLDGGVTQDGLPYLVMEYVNGVRLDDYCRMHKLSIHQRLELFCMVCAAVEYAHKNLVVHRDLKPANILVTAEGVPKLLDFGIAKLLDPHSQLAQTITSERMMTPEYASPEQVRGDQISTSTDVYALGVLLYELLAGKRPFRLDPTNPLELAKMICEQDPESPSVLSAANPALAPDAARTLRGDLDNIVLMAMRKEPARRYMSVSALTNDVQAYLTGYPVHARTDTWKYRSGKFLRRHKAGATAAAIVVVALIGFSIGMGLLANRATCERLAAQRESQFLQGIFEAATPDRTRGQQITARELLDQGAKRVDRELAGDPDLHGTMLYHIGRAYMTLGLYDQVEPLLQRAYDLRRKSLGDGNTDVADALWAWADSIRLRAEYEKAEPLFRKALAIRRAKLGEHNVAVADSLASLGECLYLENKDAEAEPLLREALAADHELHSDSGAANYLALLLERKGSYPEALQLLRESADVRRQVYGQDSPDFALALHNLAGALIDAGDLTGAEATERQALELQRKILGDNHPDLGYALNNLGFLLMEKGDWQAAEPVLRENLELRRRTMGEKNAIFASALNNWGRVLQQKGDYDQAEAAFKQALATITQAAGPQSWAAAKIISNLGTLQFDRGDFAGAESYARQALDIDQNLGGEENPQAASALIDLAEARAFQHDPVRAEPLLRQALVIRRKEFSPAHPNVIAAQVRLGEVLTAEGKAPEAEPILRGALASARSAPFPLLLWQIAEVQSALGTCLVALNRAPEGEPLIKASQADLQKDPRPAFRQSRLLDRR